MGNFEDTKPKTLGEELAYCLDELETARFNFACFVSSFKKVLEKSGLLKDGI